MNEEPIQEVGENYICLPEGVQAEAGAEFSGEVSGTISEVNGKKYLVASSVNGESISDEGEVEEKEPKDAAEAFDNYTSEKSQIEKNGETQ